MKCVRCKALGAGEYCRVLRKQIMKSSRCIVDIKLSQALKQVQERDDLNKKGNNFV